MKKIIFLLSLFIPSASFASDEDLSLCVIGWQHTGSGNYKEAIDLFHNCIKTGNLSNSSLSRTYRNLGITSKKAGYFKQAIKYYDKALHLGPSDPWDDYINRGNAWSELGNFDKAFANYAKALETKPNYNEAFYNRGIAFEKQKKFKDAIKEFVKAYKYGLRSALLFDRLNTYGLIEKK